MIKEFFCNLSIYSVQYLGWVTAIVAAILSITTIIFSQQNEKIINKSNDIALELRELISVEKSSAPSELVAKKFNKVVMLLTNRSLHRGTMLLFAITSGLIIITWVIGAVGYGMDADNYADVVVIIASTLILVIPFLCIPILISRFNKNQVIRTKKNRVKIREAIGFLQVKDGMSKGDIVKNYISPSIKFSLDRDGKLMMSANDLLQVGGYNISCKLQTTDANILVNFTVDYDKEQKVTKIKPSKDKLVARTFTGMYQLINDSRTRCEIFVSSQDQELRLLFEGRKETNNDKEIVIEIGNAKYDSVDPNLERVALAGGYRLCIIRNNHTDTYTFT